MDRDELLDSLCRHIWPNPDRLKRAKNGNNKQNIPSSKA